MFALTFTVDHCGADEHDTVVDLISAPKALVGTTRKSSVERYQRDADLAFGYQMSVTAWTDETRLHYVGTITERDVGCFILETLDLDFAETLRLHFEDFLERK